MDNSQEKSLTTIIDFHIKSTYCLIQKPVGGEPALIFTKRLTFTDKITSKQQNIFIAAWSNGRIALDLAGIETGVFQPMNLSEQKKQPSVIAQDEERLLLRLQYLNTFKACFTTAMSTNGHHSSIIGIAPPTFLSSYITDTDVVSTGAAPTVIDIKVLECATELFKAVLENGKDFVSHIDLLYHQHYLYNLQRFNECLIGTWAIIEAALNHQWDDYILKKNITGDRRKKLKGLDFTASIIQEILDLTSALPTDYYIRINKIRKARNAWMHSLKPVGKENASASLELCSDMLEKAYGVKFHIAISCSSHLIYV